MRVSQELKPNHLVCLHDCSVGHKSHTSVISDNEKVKPHYGFCHVR